MNIQNHKPSWTTLLQEIHPEQAEARIEDQLTDMEKKLKCAQECADKGDLSARYMRCAVAVDISKNLTSANVRNLGRSVNKGG